MIEFAQSQHDAIDNAFADKLAAINKAAFQPSQLQISILQSFGKGSHRLSFFTGTDKGNMRLSLQDADEALNELAANGYLSVISERRIYTLTFKGNEFATYGKKPVVTPSITFGPHSRCEPLVGSWMPIRDGGNDNMLIKSLNPCAPQVERVGA